MTLEKILKNCLEARVSNAREQDCQCINPETLCLNVEHDALLIETVSSFEFAVPARASIAKCAGPAQATNDGRQRNSGCRHADAALPVQVVRAVALLLTPSFLGWMS
jgi:hypothetical protein